MSKHTPIAPDPNGGERPKAPRGPSLVERAANVYDFGSNLRGAGQPETAPRPVEPAAPVSFAPAQSSSYQPQPVDFGPAAEPRFGTVKIEDLREGGFIVPGSGATPIAEEFRIVKRQLLRGMDDTPKGRTILISSARPDEGKTFCAVNLALSLAAEKDVEVVLVDADVAKPEILSTLGLEGGPGLIDAIADPSVDVEGCIIRTDIQGLSVLPAGRQTNEATELLASARTTQVLERLRSRDPRRIILFDSSPALAASTGSVLAMHAGQLLFVVRAEKTGETELREALELLSACPKPQLLLNGVEFGGSSRRFGQYYGIDG
ncbi:AAA family ATPase [Sphingomonas sp. CGMCC 1.13654]|uniref:AAA family ATPase n=1 Tax=Sphingomonas chungangi TaxID=2683589 RepID=A0A838LAH7_9SPHN|nr:AAA family ATPase [Sphingomonas chungangi]MBA2935842.1 AAA family ATPase [Sphingomonas chungangi]MVW54533.1 AAA family ATPase [Sphingomonas chungangi]